MQRGDGKTPPLTPPQMGTFGEGKRRREVICIFPPPGSIRFGEGRDERGKLWRWEFTEWMGPMFLRKDGEFMERQPGEKSPAWDVFEKWRKKHLVRRVPRTGKAR